MNIIPPEPIHRILLLKAELLLAEALAAITQTIFPGAEIAFANRLQVAAVALQAGSLDLLITDLCLPDGDVLDFLFLARAKEQTIRRVLVATVREDQRTLESLSGLKLDGVFDSGRGDVREFAAALQAVAAGCGYWSRTLNFARGPRSLFSGAGLESLLTPMEQLVFAVIGDGTDDKEAAARLGIKPSSVHSVRRELHRKLGVRHKGELVKLAVQHGYVRFTSSGVERPGYAMLLSGCPRRGSSAPNPKDRAHLDDERAVFPAA